MKKFLLLILASVSMLAFPAWLGAQNKSVKVNVTDSYGPVAGASVLVKGTTNGDVTDLDGNATIVNVDESSVLVISFIGYATEEVTVGRQSGVCFDKIPRHFLKVTRDGDGFTWQVSEECLRSDSLCYFKVNNSNPNLQKMMAAMSFEALLKKAGDAVSPDRIKEINEQLQQIRKG